MSTAESPRAGVLDVFVNFARSSIGAKMMMALTGVVVWGFVIGHMVGNLQIFLPGTYPGEVLNDYAHALKSTPPLLWGTRVVVAGALVVHIIVGIRLAAMNRAARQHRYALVGHRKASVAGKLMPYSGVIVLAFLVVHLLHFTVPIGWTEYLGFVDQKGQHDVYRMVLEGFSSAGMVMFYITGQLFLFMHLWHGSVSFLQSLGLRHNRWTPALNIAAHVVVGLILAGNLFMPGYVFLTHGIAQ